MKKLRGKSRKLKAFQKRLEDEASSFPAEDRPGCGYWHLHMPCSDSFIDHNLNLTRLRKQCVESILDAAIKLRSLKPDKVDARVVCSLTWPRLWDSQLIVFFGSEYFGHFFNRNSPEQKWTEESPHWLEKFFNLETPKGMTERVYLETLRDEDYESKSTLIFVGELE